MKSQTSDLEQVREFILEESKKNIAFVRKSPENVGQAKQVNTSLANIVAMERNVIMNKAIERSSGRKPNALENDV